jgi:hypothetical protein
VIAKKSPTGTARPKKRDFAIVAAFEKGENVLNTSDRIPSCS